MPRKKTAPLSDNRKQQIKNDWKTFKPKNDAERFYHASVKGGKMRAINAIKDDSGKYATREYVDKVARDLAANKGVDNLQGNKVKRLRPVDDVIKDAGITPKELKIFHEINREAYRELKERGTFQRINRNQNQLSDDVSNYNGRIYLNGEQVEKEAALFSLEIFNQYLATTINMVEFKIKPTMHISGEMYLNIPEPAEIEKALMDFLSVNTEKELRDKLKTMSNKEVNDTLALLLNSGDGNVTIITSR